MFHSTNITKQWCTIRTLRHSNSLKGFSFPEPKSSSAHRRRGYNNKLRSQNCCGCALASDLPPTLLPKQVAILSASTANARRFHGLSVPKRPSVPKLPRLIPKHWYYPFLFHCRQFNQSETFRHLTLRTICTSNRRRGKHNTSERPLLRSPNRRRSWSALRTRCGRPECRAPNGDRSPRPCASPCAGRSSSRGSRTPPRSPSGPSSVPQAQS